MSHLFKPCALTEDPFNTRKNFKMAQVVTRQARPIQRVFTSGRYNTLLTPQLRPFPLVRADLTPCISKLSGNHEIMAVISPYSQNTG